MRNISFFDVMFTSSKYCATSCFKSSWFVLIISSIPSSPLSNALEIMFFCGSMKYIIRVLFGVNVLYISFSRV